MNNAKVIAEVFKTLEENKVKVYFVNTSELKISMIIDKDNLDRITNLLHEQLVK